MPRCSCRGVRALVPLLLLALLLLPACSSGLNEVKGKVTQKGTPLKGALVFFHPQADPKAPPATGVTDEDGVYTLSTGATPGAAPGEYKVTIRWPAESKESKDKVLQGHNPPPPSDRLGGKYANPKTTKLTATVNRGSNDIPFNLD
jgi:hypothetical protein